MWLDECRNGSIKERFKWFDTSYIIDYVIIVLFIVAFSIASVAFNPYHRYLPSNDPEFSYPYDADLVPTWTLIPINIIFPILVFLITFFVFGRNFHDLHNSLLGFAETLVFTLFFTSVFKVFAGEYRPNYFEYVSISPKDASMSFPSGHSSMSFCAQLYVSLYFAGKSKLFTVNGGQLWKVIVAFIPLFAASLIAVSRTRDYHHSFTDILAGSVIGCAITYYCYYLNYPNLTSKHCHEPKWRKKFDNNTEYKSFASSESLDLNVKQ